MQWFLLAGICHSAEQCAQHRQSMSQQGLLGKGWLLSAPEGHRGCPLPACAPFVPRLSCLVAEFSSAQLSSPPSPSSCSLCPAGGCSRGLQPGGAGDGLWPAVSCLRATAGTLRTGTWPWSTLSAQSPCRVAGAQGQVSDLDLDLDLCLLPDLTADTLLPAVPAGC